MNQYLVTFESVSYCDWTVEANSIDEANFIANELISEKGNFIEERQISYDLLHDATELEEEDITEA